MYIVADSIEQAKSDDVIATCRDISDAEMIAEERHSEVYEMNDRGEFVNIIIYK